MMRNNRLMSEVVVNFAQGWWFSTCSNFYPYHFDGNRQAPMANGSALLGNSNNTAVNDLTGPQTGNFDFGLPFFFGRSVFVGINGKSTPAGTGPFTAY